MSLRSGYYATLVVVLSLFAALPLLPSLFLATSDGYYHAYRILEMDRALRSGPLPVRWAPDFFYGLGYPIFNYYAPLSYYAAEAFHLLGLGYVDALKALSVLALVGSALAAYLYGREHLAPAAAVVTAMAYVCTPYLLVDLYFRADLPEVLAFVWFPLILWSCGRLARTRQHRYLVLAALSYAALILSHNVMAFIFSPFLGLYCLLVPAYPAPSRFPLTRFSRGSLIPRGESRWIAWGVMASALLLGLGLSAFFWLPALGEKHLVAIDRLLIMDYREHFPRLGDLLATTPVHQYATVVTGTGDVYAYRLGLLQVILAAAGILALIISNRPTLKGRAEVCRDVACYVSTKGFPRATSSPFGRGEACLAPTAPSGGFGPGAMPSYPLPLGDGGGEGAAAPRATLTLTSAARLEAIFALATLAVAFYFLLPASGWAWERIPLLGLIQFPWRLLALMALPAAFLAGVAAQALPPLPWERFKGEGRLLYSLVLVPAILASALLGLRPIYTTVGEEAITTRGSLEHEVLYNTIGSTTRGEYLPATVQTPPHTSPVVGAYFAELPRPALHHVEPAEAASAEVLEYGAGGATYRVQAERPARLVFNQVYFPGWQARVNGSAVGPEIAAPQGLIALDVPPGDHQVELRLSSTPWQRRANYLSAFSGLALLAIGIVGIKTQRKKERTDASEARGRSQEEIGAVWRPYYLIPLFSLLLVVVAYFGPGRTTAATGTYDYPLSADVGGRVQLLGANLEAERITGPAWRMEAGRPLGLTFYWQATPAGEGQEYRVVGRLTNGGGKTWAFAESPWTRGEEVRPVASPLSLEIPAFTPPGVYRLEAWMFARDGSEPLPVRRFYVVGLLPIENQIQIGPLYLPRGSQASLADAAARPPELIGSFAGQVSLLSFGLEQADHSPTERPGRELERGAEGWALAAGQTLRLRLLWQAERRPQDDYLVSLHLVDDQGSLWAGRDSQPADGLYPTSWWLDGERVADQLELRLPPETPPGLYTLRLRLVGRQDPLSLLDAAGAPAGPHLSLGRLAVRPAPSPVRPEGLAAFGGRPLPLVDGLGLAGYRLGRAEMGPGERLHVDLLWEAGPDRPPDLRVALALRDGSGETWGEVRGRPVGDDYPTSQWRAGEVLRGQYDLLLSPRTPVGPLSLVVGLRDPDGRELSPGRELGSVNVVRRGHTPAGPPAIAHRVNFGNQVSLLGYDLLAAGQPLPESRPVHPGASLRLALQWQASQEMSTAYTVSTQVIDGSGRLVAQHDGIPAGGLAPTTGWLSGEVVADAHDLRLPENLPPGEYTLLVVLYDAATGRRLPVAGQDHAPLAKLVVNGATRSDSEQ